MQSPLARVILAVLAGYVMIMVAMLVYDWVTAEFPRPAPEPENAGRIQHPFHHQQALDALQRFNRLDKTEQTAIRENLSAVLVSMPQWLVRLEQTNCPILCIGERHEEATRRYLAEAIFQHYKTDILLLETTPDTVNRLLARRDGGRAYFPLLGADILAVLRAAAKGNPAVDIYGIEETGAQAKQDGRTGSRDRAIAENFWDRYQPGKRHVILFGALHCADGTDWLFDHLRADAPDALTGRMGNAQVLEVHQNGPLEAFVFFLDTIGVFRKNFVIADTGALHPRIARLFEAFNRQILERYDALIVFRRSSQ